MESLVDDHEVARALAERRIAEPEPAADVHERVLLAAHRRAVGEVAHQAQDFGDRAVAHFRLALLDEPRVLHGARRVEDHLDAARVAVFVHGAEVRDAHGLPAREVHRQRHADVRDALRSHLAHQRIELGEVHVPLERVLRRRVVRLVDDHVVERAARQLLVQPRRREIHVAGNVIPRLDEDLRENVLGAAPLVRGDQLRIAVDVADGLLEVVEVSRAGIRLIAHHHPGPLAIAHRARARIGEQVDVDVLGLDEERVETGLADVTLALRACGHVNRLDDLDLPGLGPAAMAHHFHSPGAFDARLGS